MNLDVEVMRQFYLDMSKADAATFDPEMTHDELAQSLAGTSGIDNQVEVGEVLGESVIPGVLRAAYSTGQYEPRVIASAIAHVSFELGYKMGLYVSTQKPD